MTISSLELLSHFYCLHWPDSLVTPFWGGKAKKKKKTRSERSMKNKWACVTALSLLAAVKVLMLQWLPYAGEALVKQLVKIYVSSPTGRAAGESRNVFVNCTH